MLDKSGSCKGIAWITFSDRGAFDKAVSHPDGQMSGLFGCVSRRLGSKTHRTPRDFGGFLASERGWSGCDFEGQRLEIKAGKQRPGRWSAGRCAEVPHGAQALRAGARDAYAGALRGGGKEAGGAQPRRGRERSSKRVR